MKEKLFLLLFRDRGREGGMERERDWEGEREMEGLEGGERE